MRCENLVVVRKPESRQEDGPQMLQFEAITLAPFDLCLIDRTLLTEGERTWLNRYHNQVRETIGPGLPGEDREWLNHATRAI